MTLRPDEEAALAEQGRNRKFESSLKSGAKLAGNAALTASGVGLSARLLPLLSEHIPLDLAMKGINKISPKIGAFLEKGASMGLNVEEGLQFLKDKLTPAKEEIEKNNKPQNLNELGQFSPELQQFVEDQIQGGKSPDHAAALAMNEANLSDTVRGIEKKTKKKFTAFVRDIYEGKAVGSKAALQNPGQQQQQMQGDQGLDPGVAEILAQGKALMQQFKGGM